MAFYWRTIEAPTKFFKPLLTEKYLCLNGRVHKKMSKGSLQSNRYFNAD